VRSVALALMLALLVPAADVRVQVRARPVQAPAAGDLFVLTAAGGELERVRGRNRLRTSRPNARRTKPMRPTAREG
jgi:hypothetical protein